jgi:hypothetical protein
MTQIIPRVEVTGITYPESGTRTLHVNCPRCRLTHSHVWPLNQMTIGHRVGPCGMGYHIDIPDWAFTHRTGYAKRNWLDDNAIHDPANNWEE